MSAPELHPDDLLDKEARGDLSNDEQARLDEHLAACSICRFERDVRGDFRADFEELALAAPTTKTKTKEARRDDRVVVMADAVVRARKRSSRVRLVGIIAAALLVATGAAAEFRELWTDASETPPAPAVSPTIVVPSGPASHVTPAATGPRALATNAALADAATSAVEASPSAATSETATPPQAPRPPTTTIAQTSPPTPPPPSATATTAPEPTPPPATAGALFSQASDARQRGAYDDAVRLYGDLAQRYPGSVEATNAHAMLGRLLLDRGDAARALVHFDADLSGGGGGLREEAMVGRALALQRLGRVRDEAAAWSALVDAYPKSVHSARARARLAALENR